MHLVIPPEMLHAAAQLAAYLVTTVVALVSLLIAAHS
jgi:hypothetical protein